VRDAVTLAAAGAHVRVLLIQDAVSAALPSGSEALDALLAAGGEALVDDHSLAQRGLAPADLRAGVTVVGMDAIGTAVLDPGVRVVWR
jgi:sulfur transfer complex TusBCD TusB component (DsrH family)